MYLNQSACNGRRLYFIACIEKSQKSTILFESAQAQGENRRLRQMKQCPGRREQLRSSGFAEMLHKRAGMLSLGGEPVGTRLRDRK